MINSQELKKDFPILDQLVHDEGYTYLDNAATSQKPKQVLDRIRRYYDYDNANVHRGVHTLAERATRDYEASRQKVANFINANSSKEIVFTRGTTTSLNWVAQFAKQILKPGDEVLISIMEHHANLIPWQEVCRQTGASLVYAYLKEGTLDLDDFKAKVTSKTRFVCMAHVSNVLGCVNPIQEITAIAHGVGAYMVVDGAQSVPHMAVDVQALNCDFLAFSGHKMLGPTGIGVLYGKEEVLNLMDPVEFGGEMIDFVYEQEASWKSLPWKLEAGTPNIAGAIGLAAAIDYLESLGMSAIQNHERELVSYILPKLQAIDGLKLYGPGNPMDQTGVLSFNLDGLHPHDVATALDYEGIAVRAGHHCAQPLLRHLEISAAVRASFYIYNTREDCDRLVEAILKTKEFFSGTL
ncbi:cysteine desulfurase [Streptococcus uberis]|uniref:cysteine desulfurase n=1 Tax=Streptococcus uberis TaxID=1349 RepID=UPI0006203DAC|nr:cysteine desulfurase [Streptococcus uberis]KKF44833.1 cysteine desulfurase [Streptococcus uberis EF20/0145]MTB61812.1 SufS family cysteine desulfurase [Streptococcus uberis]MTB91821.1 SufS family cysteine desulfurase [Streptococcus uberis]MTC89583.1 SufS family cysteine desulfurase [Streptococcus uberis]MWV51777.1 SufS family cysteine desulfurase [Streptococcus uberis]